MSGSAVQRGGRRLINRGRIVCGAGARKGVDRSIVAVMVVLVAARGTLKSVMAVVAMPMAWKVGATD